MSPQIVKFPDSLMWIACIAIIVFCAIGIMAIIVWIPTSLGHFSNGQGYNHSEQHPVEMEKSPASAKASIQASRASQLSIPNTDSASSTNVRSHP
jgi:flagellar basal body-associated protein FliL